MSLEFDVEKAQRIVPLTIVYVLMVASTNLCLQYVQVSFFQVPRSPSSALPLATAH
jgi:GDP-fucose transporter C1